MVSGLACCQHDARVECAPAFDTVPQAGKFLYVVNNFEDCIAQMEQRDCPGDAGL